MADFIVLTESEADSVRGPTAGGAALEPVLRQGDLYILGVEVLDDPAHAEHRDYLATLPVLADDDVEFPPALPDPVVMAAEPASRVPTSAGRPRGRPRKS